MAGYTRASIRPYNSLSTPMPHSLDDISPTSHEDWMASWTVPARLVLETQGGVAAVDIDL